MTPEAARAPPIDRLHIAGRGRALVAAAVRDGRIDDILAVALDDPAPVGAVFLGRVRRVDKARDAAFVALSATETGLLRARDTHGAGAIARRVHEGQAVLVQVTRAAHGDKGPLVSARVRLDGARLRIGPDASPRPRSSDLDDLDAEAAWLAARWRALEAAPARAPALLDAPDPALSVLFAFAHALRGDVVVDDLGVAARLRRWAETAWPALAPLVRIDDSPDLDAELAALHDPQTALPNGGRLTIEATRALTVIDVDSGGATGAAVAVNRAAAAELGRQMRLRDLGGIIIVDFIDMRARGDREAVLAAFRGAVRADRMAVDVKGFTRLGLVELTRRRSGPSAADAIGPGPPRASRI